MEGPVEVKMRALSRLPSRRFGSLPAWAQARLSTAQEEELDHWFDAVLDAGSVTDVLGPSPSDDRWFSSQLTPDSGSLSMT